MARRIRFAAGASEKYCPRCKTVKPKAAFRKHRKRIDGLSPYCDECMRKYDHERYLARKETK